MRVDGNSRQPGCINGRPLTSSPELIKRQLMQSKSKCNHALITQMPAGIKFQKSVGESSQTACNLLGGGTVFKHVTTWYSYSNTSVVNVLQISMQRKSITTSFLSSNSTHRFHLPVGCIHLHTTFLSCADSAQFSALSMAQTHQMKFKDNVRQYNVVV